ncbi:MAG: DUF262 domain-containing protein [Chloroherpetonaceae bacterium]
MEASVTRLVELLGDARQYLVPLFQRPYSWERKEWQTLWDDIVELCETETPRPHFFGTIVTIPARSVPEGVTKFSLIDGQQRYTTVSVLFAAMCQVAKQKEENRLAEEIQERFLINKFAEGNDYFKLLPTQSDREDYKKIILGKSPHRDSRLSKAFHFFESQLRKSEFELSKIKTIIERYFSIVRVLLDEKDDPYLVFESLNAKGMPLSQADLIRNYFLMRLHTNRQEEIHAQFWLPMEMRLGEKNLTEFIRHYLVMRKSDFVKAAETYLTLKEYVESKKLNPEHELKQLHQFSTYYAKLLERQQEPDADIRRALIRLNRLEVTTAYPFLLACYHDYAQQHLSSADFVEILRTLENFIVRRFVCSVPTNQLSKIFSPLYRQVQEKVQAQQIPFVESLKDILEQRNYPKDYEFKPDLIENKLYGSGDRGKKTKFILETIEEFFEHRESVLLNDLQIEHVMPQTLTAWWQSHLGQNWEFVHEKYLDTLGNLTLTGYNPELSNADFAKKKSIYKNSHLELNAYFNDVETWRESDIALRGEVLAEKCLKIWAYFGKQNIQEQVSTDAERAYTFETMHNSDFLTGEVLELFEDLQDRVLSLAGVEENVLKQCISYRAKSRTFLSVVPQRSGLKLYLNLPPQEVRQYTFCRDVSKVGHWGTGDVEVKLKNLSDIDRTMPLIEQAYQKQ